MNDDIIVTFFVDGTVQKYVHLSHSQVAKMSPIDFGHHILDEVEDDIPQADGEWKIILVDGNDKHRQKITIDDEGGSISSRLCGPLFCLLDNYRGIESF